MSETMITIRHLRKEYPNVTPLKDVSTEIKKGEVISIIGPSGTGKSTFLRCINLLEKPTSGEILIHGVPITSPKSNVPALRRKTGSFLAAVIAVRPGAEEKFKPVFLCKAQRVACRN